MVPLGATVHGDFGFPTCEILSSRQSFAPVRTFADGRRLAMLAIVRADVSLRKGDDRAGLEDLAAVIGLGRHIGRGLYVSGLAGFPIEDLAVTRAFGRESRRLKTRMRCQ